MEIPGLEKFCKSKDDRFLVQDRLASGVYSTINEEGKISEVWANFYRVVDETKKPLNFVMCKYCDSVFKHVEKNGTSTLWRHMKEPGCTSNPKKKKTKFCSLIAGLNLLMPNPHTPFLTGEDRKVDLSSLIGGASSSNVAQNDNSLGSTGDVPGVSEEGFAPSLSPEQILTEDTDQPTSRTSTPQAPQRPESYRLRHNNHLTLVLDSLANDESFMDVTLTAQGRAIKAHKSVLSAVSPYFKSVLKENPCQHPIIIMPRDIKFEELNNIISYVYRGEMTVAAEDISSLLKTAEILQVAGLIRTDGSAVNSSPSSILGQIGASSGIFTGSSSVKPSTIPQFNPVSTKTSVKKKHQSTKAKPAAKKSEPSNISSDSQDKMDPLEFLNADMTYVKEEVTSDEEFMTDPLGCTETVTGTESTSASEPPQQDDEQSQQNISPVRIRKHSETTHPPADMESQESSSSSCERKIRPSLSEEESAHYNKTVHHICPYCMEAHRPTTALQTHLRLKHPSKPSFLCKCGRVFTKHSLLREHEKSCESA